MRNYTPDKLITVYNTMVGLMVHLSRCPAYGRRRKFVGYDLKSIALAELLLKWLEEKNYDVGPYLAGAFGEHHWAYQPIFSRLTAKRYEVSFRNYSSVAYKYWFMVSSYVSSADPVSLGREIIKARYKAQQNWELCRLQKDLSGGYCSKSEICKSCSIWRACQSDVKQC